MIRSRILTLWVALAVVLVACALWSPGFFTLLWRDGRVHGAMVDVLRHAAPVALVALGMTLVIGTGGIDLSVGAIMAIAGTMAAQGFARADLPVALVVPFALVVGALLGAWNGLLIHALALPPLVATLVLLTAGRGLAQVLADGQIVPCARDGFAVLASGAWLALPVPVWIAAALALALAFVTRGTTFGLALVCLGDNARAARLSGLPVVALSFTTYVLSGICSAGAGLIETAEIRQADADRIGLYVELDAILAVVLGGTPLAGGRMRIAGTLLGVVIVQALAMALVMGGAGKELALCAKAALVLIVCARGAHA